MNVFRFSVREFLGRVCKYGSLRDVITPNLNKICTFLEQNPQYAGIDQLEIDFNLIEVSGSPNHMILDFDFKACISSASTESNIDARFLTVGTSISRKRSSSGMPYQKKKLEDERLGSFLSTATDLTSLLIQKSKHAQLRYMI